MIKKSTTLNLLFIVLSTFCFLTEANAQIITMGEKKFELLSSNLISNPGFESGFTGWTDATPSAATLTSEKFNIPASGGVDDSSYLIGLNNEGSSSSGSIGTGWALESGKSYLFAFKVKFLDDARPPGTGTYIRASLTNDKTSNAEPEIIINGAQIDGEGAWTQNYAYFTNSGTVYSYVMARFRWLSNLYGFDDFMLYEAQEVINYDILQATIDEAQALYDSQANDAAIFLDAINEAQTYLSSNSITEVEQATTNLRAAITAYNYANASSSTPLDLTSFIVNPSFESFFDGWTNNGMSTINSSVFPNKDGDLIIEKWVSRGQQIPDVGVQQEINDLPNGFYSLTITAGNIQQTGAGSIVNNTTEPQTGAFLFANDNKTNIVSNTIEDHTVDFFVTDGTITLGIKAENATGNWLSCDNFILEYKGFDVSESKTYIQELINAATPLLAEKMQDEARTPLVNAINSGNQAISNQAATQETLASVIQELKDKTVNAQASVNAYSDLQTVIDAALVVYGDGTGNEAAELSAAIDTATDASNDFSLSLEDIYNATDALSSAIFKYNLANATGTPPTVVTNPDYLRGATMAFGRSTISGADIASLNEHGFCWSTAPEPTVLDHRTTKSFSSNGYIYHIENLEPSTLYYMRAYAITSGNAVGYGEVIKFITIPKGTVTYSLTSSLTGEHRTRVGDAVSSAVNYFNDLTSIQGHHITVHYGSGTPTAEASYGGFMRFGPNPSYQRTGTALHEMGHTIGVGTHSMWYGPSSPLRETGSSGAWLGENANHVVKFISNDPNEYLRGDSVHMWPYGINGASEDTGSELLYITNSLVHQALGEDGLPPTGGFATPSYTFELEDGATYYIKSEDAQTGLDDAFIAVDGSGNLINEDMTTSEALTNDNAAWEIAFNPVNSYYTIKNVATGRYFTFNTTGDNGISTAIRTTPITNDYFQFMRNRTETTIGAQTYKSYWIVHPEANTSPATFTATVSDLTTTSGFNFADSSTSQRWLLIKSDEMPPISSGLSVSDELISDLRIYPVPATHRIIVEANSTFAIGALLNIYDITGRIIKSKKLKKTTSKIDISNFPSGMYMLKISNNGQSVVKHISKR